MGKKKKDLRARVEKAIDSYHSTLVLRHDIKDPIARERTIDELTKFVGRVLD